MVKPITVLVTYNDKNESLNCCQNDFMDKVAEVFNIDKKDIVIFLKHKADRYKIQPHDLNDLMRVEIRNMKENDTRNLRSHFSVQSKLMESFKKTVKDKLVNNKTLTGIERRQLIEILDAHPNFSNKRKHSTDSQPDTAHKKIQVDLYSKLTKDSCCQADFGNIQQNNVGEVEDVTAINEMKALSYNRCEDKGLIKRKMDQTFQGRRNFIMVKIPSVGLVRDKYPLLFSFEEIKNELERIFFPGICVQFINRMQKKASRIVEMSSKDDEVYRRMIKRRESAITEKQQMYATVVASIFILAKNLDEEYSFIHFSDKSSDSSDIYPHISGIGLTLKDVFSDTLLFHIVVEDRKVCEAPTIPEAILCLMAIYFIFNINYPESCRRTCIVFEKVFLGANDTADIDKLTMQTIKFLECKA